jgi:hypothetical protein
MVAAASHGAHLGFFGKLRSFDPSAYETTGFFDTVDQLSEGDLVLFRTRRFTSRLQRFFVDSGGFDHVGIVVVYDECDPAVCCPAELKEARRRAGVRAWHTLEADSSGVSLYRFTPTCLGAYKGVVCVRHLSLDPDRFPRPAFGKVLREFVTEMHGRPYETDMMQMLRAGGFFGVNEADDLSSVFCSELVAAAYIRLGLLAPDRPSNAYIPGDFCSKNAGSRRAARLAPGAALSRERVVDCNNMRVERARVETQGGPAAPAPTSNPFPNDGSLRRVGGGGVTGAGSAGSQEFRRRKGNSGKSDLGAATNSSGTKLSLSSNLSELESELSKYGLGAAPAEQPHVPPQHHSSSSSSTSSSSSSSSSSSTLSSSFAGAARMTNYDSDGSGTFRTGAGLHLLAKAKALHSSNRKSSPLVGSSGAAQRNGEPAALSVITAPRGPEPSSPSDAQPAQGAESAEPTMLLPAADSSSPSSLGSASTASPRQSEQGGGASGSNRSGGGNSQVSDSFVRFVLMEKLAGDSPSKELSRRPSGVTNAGAPLTARDLHGLFDKVSGALAQTEPETSFVSPLPPPPPLSPPLSAALLKPTSLRAHDPVAPTSVVEKETDGHEEECSLSETLLLQHGERHVQIVRVGESGCELNLNFYSIALETPGSVVAHNQSSSPGTAVPPPTSGAIAFHLFGPLQHGGVAALRARGKSSSPAQQVELVNALIAASEPLYQEEACADVSSCTLVVRRSGDYLLSWQLNAGAPPAVRLSLLCHVSHLRP